MGTAPSCHAIKDEEGHTQIKNFGLTQSQTLKAKYLGIDITKGKNLEGKGADWMKIPIAEAKEKWIERNKIRR